MRSNIIAFVVGACVSLCALHTETAHAWTRNYGRGGQRSGTGFMGLIDDSVMPLSRLTSVTAVLDNEISAQQYGGARCGYVTFDVTGFYVGPWVYAAPGLGTERIVITGSNLASCQRAIDAAPYVETSAFGTNATGVGFFFNAILTNGT